MQRQYSYNPPNEDLINAVVLLTTYLFADTQEDRRKRAVIDAADTRHVTLARRHQSSPSATRQEIERAKEMLQAAV